VLFPTPAAGDPLLAVLGTTSGGLVAGDRLDIGVRLAMGAAAHVTASAAEKVYRSIGPTTVIRQSLSVAAGAALEFLPLETTLFDGARLWRETIIELGPGAAFLGGDILVFGRRALGERFTRGFLREVWQVRREGSLVWGDALYLEDDIAQIIDHPACFDGAAAFATLILAPSGRDPRGFLDGARTLQSIGAAEGLRSGGSLRSPVWSSPAGSRPTQRRFAEPMPIWLVIFVKPQWSCRR
jgi:urease accessory protein